MVDRPILFSAPMIRALLVETKTQTRRLLKPQPHLMSDKGLSYIGTDGKGHTPRIEAGDRLWVKETWKPHSIYADLKPSQIPPSTVFFRADDAYAPSNTKWWPSLFMLRWASRLTLTVTDVRIERLNAITREDAIAEGLIKAKYAPPMAVEMGCNWGFEGDDRYGSPISAYAALWNHINGAGAWEANPWVVAYTFTVHHGNIDQIAQVAA